MLIMMLLHRVSPSTPLLTLKRSWNLFEILPRFLTVSNNNNNNPIFCSFSSSSFLSSSSIYEISSHSNRTGQTIRKNCHTSKRPDVLTLSNTLHHQPLHLDSKVFNKNVQKSQILAQHLHLPHHHLYYYSSHHFNNLTLLRSFHLSTCRLSSNSSNDSSQPPKVLHLSDRCRAQLAKVLDSGELLRIGVRGGGCSGFEYEFSVCPRSEYQNTEDLLFDNKVVVDRESIELMAGATLDYEEELIRSGFRIVANPLAEKGCSCGASFSLKIDL